MVRCVKRQSKIVPFNIPAGGNEGVTLQSVDEVRGRVRGLALDSHGEAWTRGEEGGDHKIHWSCCAQCS